MKFSELLLSVCLLVSTKGALTTSHDVTGNLGELVLTCRHGWKLYQGNCYLVVDLQRTFNDAKSICERQGGELWYFENEFEYSDFLKPIAPSQIWTGLHRVNEEWIMHGEDTNLRTLHGWADNMPDETGGIDCSFVDSQDGMLTEDCDQMHAFVCKQTSCLEGYMPCATGGKCINISRDVCNDRFECDDRSDERHCPSKCSTYSSLMDPSGTITIDGIQDDTDCTWVLEAPIGKLVKLTIQGMTLEMNRAFIEAWTGRPTIPGSRRVTSLTGTIEEQIVYSDNNFLIIRVYAGDLERPIGRRVLSWTTDIPYIVEGEIELEATENFRYLEFPFGENSPQGVTLSWRITAPEGELITYVAELKDSTKYGEDANVDTIPDGIAFSGLHERFYLSTYHTTASNVISISMEYTTTINDYQIKFIKGCNLEVEVNWDLDFSSPGFEYGDSTHNYIYPANVKCEWNLISNKAFSFELDQRDLASDDRTEPTVKSVDTLEVCGYNESGHEIASKCWENEDIPYRELISFERNVIVTFESGPALSGEGFWFSAAPDCPQLDVSSYTNVTPNRSHAGYDENLSCLDGYRFNVQKYTNNELSLHCTKPNGEWDRELLPECQIVYCGTPDEIDNGYISNVTGVIYESKAYYTCNDGFTMTSLDEVTCQSDGEWSPRPSCTSSSCSVLQNVIPNGGFNISEGMINTEAEFNTVVQFYCNDQFELKGVDISHCTNQGWTHVLDGYGLPECKDIRCPVLYIEHGVHNSAIKRVTCDNGYQIYYPGIDANNFKVNMDIQCQHNRTYTFDVTCVDIDECSDDIDNCVDSTSTCENTDGSFNCNCLQGYQGGFCSDINECAESPCDGDNGDCKNTIGSYTCSCDSGYVLYTGRGTEGFNHPSIETAEMVGDVYRINHSCVRKQCDALTSVSNSMFLKKELTFFHYEDSVELQCSDGYHIDGMFDNVVSMVSTCEADGEWDNLYTCTERRCSLPALPLNGVSYDKTDVFFGDTVKLTCNMTASSTRVLSAKCIYESPTVMRLVGDDLTVCPEIDCGNPADVLPPGSNVPNSYSPKHLDGQGFQFTCATGYQHIEGSSTTVTCGEEGRWLLDTNTCIGETCPDPGTPGDATQMAESYEPDSILYYDCTRPGFMPILNGQEAGNYTCTQDGNSALWVPSLSTSNLPVCKDVTQPAFENCPSDMAYDAMDTVSFNVPQASDNFGVKSLGRNSATINGKVILGTTDVTYTAKDFENKEETCAFQLRVINRNVKPNLSCPPSVEYRVVNNEQTIVNVSDYVSVSGGSIDTVSPSQVIANIARIGSATTVTVTASNDDNTESTCKFMIYFTAGACFEESLYPDSNAQRDCTNTDGSLSCTSTCRTNYVYDNGDTSKTFTCSGTNVWNFADLDLDLFCLPYKTPAYAMDALITYAYDEVNLGCLDEFNGKLESSLSTFRQRLGNINVCGGIWDVTVVSTREADKITEFESTLRLELVDTSNINRDECIQSINASLTSIFAVIGNTLTCNGASQPLVVDKTDSSLGAASLRCTDESYHETNNINFGFICVPCGYGYFYNGDTNVCQRCAADQYQDTVNQVQCKTCPNSHAPDIRSIDCIATCPSGYSSTNGFYPCTPCPVDQYWTDSKTCTSCPDGESTVGQTGTTSENQCYAPCPAGSYSHTGYNIPGTGCSPCPRNFYQGLSGQTVCDRCATTAITTGLGSTDISDCTNIDGVCDGSYCDNHGTCVYTDYNERVCSCDDGYFGVQCKIRQHICDFTPCTNGGQCVEGDTIDAYTCTCASVELDQCNMEILYDDRTGTGTGARYNTINLGSGSTQEMCENHCVNDAACLEASYAIIGTSGNCFLYNEANVPTVVNDLPVVTQVHMRKICIHAFEGDNCEIDNINECDNYDCDSTASCKNKIGGAECLCSSTAGNTGDKCEIAKQPCSPDPCDSTGTDECAAFGNVRYLCYCRPGYTGQHCETNIDECELHGHPCLNNGACEDRINSWRCQCVSGNFGTYCENEPNHCSSINCVGDNVCYNSLDDDEAVCSCYDDGYFMTNDSNGECAQVNFACDTKGCINGACRQLSSSAYKEAVCDCESGFTGSLCQHSIDDCNNNLCQNGECQDGHEGYTCLCQDGYTGKYCTENIDECEDSTCNPDNSKCVDGVYGYTCECNTGYKGINCEEDIDECEDYPCQHGGTCTTTDVPVGTYKCECGDSWTGTNCQTRVNLCPGRNCNNNGQCYTLVNSTFCRCSGAAQGENCEDVKDVCGLFQEQGVDLCVNGKCVNSDGSAQCQCNQDHNKEQCFFDIMDGYTGKGNFDNTLTQRGSQFTQETCKTSCLNIADCEAVMIQVIAGEPRCYYYRTGTVEPTQSEEEILFVRQCPSDYAGKSCELIKSWCEVGNNQCENGATCRELAPRGYACDCQPGYSGPTCNIAANPCSGNPCGSQAMCRSTLTEYICMCPQGREFDGTNCRVCNTNYVLLVNTLAGESTAGLQTAFKMHTTELSFIIRIRVHDYKTTTPVLFTLFGSNDLKPEKDGSTFILEVDTDGVKVTDQDNEGKALSFEANGLTQDLVDGEWHFIAGAINSNGDLSMIINAVASETVNVMSSGLDIDVNAQIKLGEGVLAEYEDVTVYDTYLSTLERNLANVDDFSKPESLIQDWCNYELSMSTSRKAQRSTISLKQDENTAPPDLQCIDDPIYITPPGVQGQRIVQRQDNQIKNRLNHIQESNRGLEYNDSLPDVMRYGFYSGIVVGFDQYGNYAECRFPIYIRANEQCPAHESPETSPVIDVCGETGGVCGLTCSNSATRVSAPTPKYMACGSLGVYNTEHPYQNPVLPPCTLVVSTKFVVTAYMDFRTHTNCAVTSEQQLKDRFNDVFDEIEEKWVDICNFNQNFNDKLCPYLELMPVQCIDEAKMITVGFTLELPGNKLTYLGVTPIDVLDAINIIILEEKLIDLSNLNGAELIEDSVDIKVEEKCTSTGYNLVETGQCAPCGKGFYYNGNDDVEKCVPCPIGQYQNQEAQLECMNCTVDTTTYQMGAVSSDQCIDICPVGKYMLEGSCAPCPRHTYQDMEGQNFCKVCELGYKTISEESTSEGQCLEDCPAGEERDSESNSCMPCARGSWRSIVWDDCQPCSEGTTTMENAIAVSDDDCDMTICELGEFWNVTGRECVQCDYGYYTDELLALECKQCRGNLTTRDMGASNWTDCEFYCAAGYEQVDDTETCFPCERGDYKDNDGNTKFDPCLACGVKTTDTVGATTVDQCILPVCEIGQYISENECTDCDYDEWADNSLPDLSTECESCSGCSTCNELYGTNVTMATSADQCYRYCGPGEFYDMEMEECEICPQGTYKDNIDVVEGRFGGCVQCPNDNVGALTTDGDGAISKDNCTTRVCDVGKFVTDDNTCESCGYDTYQPIASPFSYVECQDCPPTDMGISQGTDDVGTANMSDCMPYCPAGQFYDDNGQCTDCPMGSYKEEDNRFGMCDLCSVSRPDYTNDILGANSSASCDLRDCGPGTFLNEAGDDCIDCPQGQYQDQRRASLCIPCGPNLNTSSTGAQNISECQVYCLPGLHGRDVCVPCPFETSKPSAGYDDCEPCGPGLTSNDDRTECNVVYCYFGNEFKIENNVGVCQPCNEGFFKDTKGNDDVCQVCPTRLTTNGTGQSSCDIFNCLQGEYWNEDTNQCSDCGIGTYKNSIGNDTCTVCPPKSTTLVTKVTSIAGCDTNVCDPGKYREPSQKNVCSDCPVNTYQNENGATECKPCAQGNITLAVGTMSSEDCVTECIAGQKYVADTKSCVACSVGTYKSEVGNLESCTACPTDTTTLTTGSTRSSLCNQPVCKAGTRSEVSGSRRVCITCELNTYSDQIQQLECTACVPGTVTQATGRTSALDCIGFLQDKKKLAKLTQFKSDIAWVKAEFQDGSKKQRVDESSEMTETDSDTDIGSQFVSAETNAKTLESDKEGSIDPDKTCVCEPESEINSDKEISIEPESDIDSDKESSIEPEVTTRASCLLRDGHFDNQLKLPHPKDIEMVATKLSSTLADYDYQDMTQYVKIAKTVLLRLMIYNRRRSGEIEELQMKTYLNRKTEVEDVEKSPLGELSPTEQYLIKSQELMWIRGELGKLVPVLIPSDAIKALNYILDPEVRKLAELKATNKYMFATRGDGVISASESLKELGSGMELIHPDRLSSTGYRAYMASIALQCLGLKDHQIQWLCTHLGHTEDVHKTHYRFALDGIERIQLAKLLLLQDRNLLSKYKNTKLEDIEFEGIVSSTSDEVAGIGEGAPRTEAVCGDDNDGGEFGPDSFEDCALGHGFDNTKSKCEICPIGQYNDKVTLPNTCKLCPNGKKNIATGSTSCDIDVDPTPTVTVTQVVVVRVKYVLLIDECLESTLGDILRVLLDLFRREFLKKQSSSRFSSNTSNGRFCQGPNCNNLGVAIVPDSCGSRINRRKRATQHDIELDLTFNNVSETLTDRASGQSIEVPTTETIAQILQTSGDTLDAPGGITYDSLDSVSTTPVCLPGQIMSNSICVPCVVGEYWTEGVCEPCGSDKFQNMTGQTSCHDCPPNTFHDHVRQTTVSNCLRFCNQNANYCNSRGTCVETGRRAASCDCRDGYSGNTCVNKDVPSSNMPVILGAAIGGGGALLILILLVVGLYRYLTVKDEKKKKKRKYQTRSEEQEFYHNSPLYDNHGGSFGSSQARPFAPYPSIGYPALGYRPDTSMEEPAYSQVYKNRPSVEDDGGPTFVWTA